MYIIDYKKNKFFLRKKRFFTVNFTRSSFSLSKTVNLTVFYNKIISQLFSAETFC